MLYVEVKENVNIIGGKHWKKLASKAG